MAYTDFMELTENQIKEIQENVIKTDNEITAPRLKNITQELNALYNDLAGKIPASNLNDLEAYLLQLPTEIHEAIKGFYW